MTSDLRNAKLEEEVQRIEKRLAGWRLDPPGWHGTEDLQNYADWLILQLREEMRQFQFYRESQQVIADAVHKELASLKDQLAAEVKYRQDTQLIYQEEVRKCAELEKRQTWFKDLILKLDADHAVIVAEKDSEIIRLTQERNKLALAIVPDGSITDMEGLLEMADEDRQVQANQERFCRQYEKEITHLTQEAAAEKDARYESLRLAEIDRNKYLDDRAAWDLEITRLRKALEKWKCTCKADYLCDNNHAQYGTYSWERLNKDCHEPGCDRNSRRVNLYQCTRCAALGKESV